MKERSTTANEIVNIAQKALEAISPPPEANLRECHLPYFKDIVDARHEWTRVDLRHAANLARVWYDIDVLNKDIEREGYTIYGGKSGKTLVQNPSILLRESLLRQSVTLSTKLQIHAQATMGESRDQKDRNKKKKEVLDGFNSLDDDTDLIARPN